MISHWKNHARESFSNDMLVDTIFFMSREVPPENNVQCYLLCPRLFPCNQAT